ncbi:MAG: hypothetical protein IJR82_01385 [Bacilli bacterium]|nr:hypothetical protein [Bacilli bacterium]
MNNYEMYKANLLKEQIYEIKKQAIKEGRFSLFMISSINEIFNRPLKYKVYKYYFNLIKLWDNKCHIPWKLGQDLLQTMEQYEFLFVPYQVYLNDINTEIPYDEDLFDIMKNGLIIDSRISSVELSKIATSLKDIEGYIKLLDCFSENIVMVLIRLPKYYLDKDGKIINESICNEIYYVNGEQDYRINPEYMYGVLFKGNNGLDDFYYVHEVLSNMSYSNFQYVVNYN